jgi:RND family efflux transporter MFP subunit
MHAIHSRSQQRVKPVKFAIGTGARTALLMVAVALGTAGCGEKEAKRGSAGGPRRAPRIAVVETAPVEVGTIARRVTVSGVVEPIRSVGINSQIAGALLAVAVQEGDVVRSGTVLARLDDRELRAQVASASASHEMAEANFQRSERLLERQVITAAEYDRDRTAFAAAEAQLQQLRTRLDYSTIRAPITGVVTEKRVEAGDIIGVQTRLFTLADVDTMVVRVQVSELDVVQLRPGDAVAVALDAFPGRTLSGRIRRIFPAADPTTRLVPVEVALRQEGERIARAGFLARIELALGARTDVLLVPASAVVGDASSAAVFVVEDGAALRRTVRTGLNSEGRVEILAGLKAGDPVVVAGNNGLRDGAEVRVVGRGGAVLDDSGAQRASAAESTAASTMGGNTP